MRVTNSMIYDSVIRHTSTALERYYALSEQNASMKKVNSPSDDPAGYASILALRDHMGELDQFLENADTATGWLGAADSTLQQASDLLISAMELAEQGATDSLDGDQRAMLAEQAREYLASLVTLANTDYDGQSIFAGQATDGQAYAMALYADVIDQTLDGSAVVSVEGGADYSVMVQFLDSGDIGGAADLEYRYSADGGDTWTTATLTAGDTELDLGTCRVGLAAGSTVTAETGDGLGTSLRVRPSAVYLGDADDGAVVTAYADSVVTASAVGGFGGSVVVRIDADGDIASGTVSYSYSTDGGNTWIEGNTSEDGVFSVAGGYLNLASNGGSVVLAGDQYVISPDTAEATLALSETSSVAVTNVGLDAFGGLYQGRGESAATAVEGGNAFEAMGRLIGALETNDVDAVARCLEELGTAQEALLDVEAGVGARENRVTAAQNLLQLRSSSDETLLSSIEDVDVTELMVELESAATVYQSVVETSTAIMQLSLVNFI